MQDRRGFLVAALLLTAGVATARADDAVAVVNGEAIDRETWIARMQTVRVQSFIVSTSPLQFNQSADAGQIALETLVNERLVLQYAKKHKALPGDSEIEAEMRTAEKQPSVAQAIANKRFSEAQLRND